MENKLSRISEEYLGDSISNYFRPRKSTNDVYIIKVNNKHYCIKISSTDYLGAFRSEPNIQKIVNSKTNIPVANVIKIDFSREIIPKDFFIMEFIEGKTGADNNFNVSENKNLIKKFKQNYKELSKIEFNDFGFFHYNEESKRVEIFPKYSNWNEILENEVKIISDKMKQTRFRYLSEYHKQFYLNNKHILEKKNIKPKLINSDYRFENIIIDNNNIKAILDWGSCLCGDIQFGLKKMEFLIDNPTTKYTLNEKEVVRNNKITKFYEVLMYMYIMSGFNIWFSNLSRRKKGIYEQKIRESYKNKIKEYKKI